MSEPDRKLLECVLLSFYYEENPLLGERTWTSPRIAIWERSMREKPMDYPSTYDDPGPGIVFAGYQALGSFRLPLVFCAHHYRHHDRERNTFYRMDVINVVRDTVELLPSEAAAAVLARLEHLWYRYPRKRYDFESWHPIVHRLACTVAASAEHAAAWRKRYPHLLVAPRVWKKSPREYNRRRQALDWLRRHHGQYRLVQEGFAALGYPSLESVCEAAGGFSITRLPQPGMERRLIGLLEESVHALCGDFFGPGKLPRCEIIEDERAVWAGMAVCIPRRTPLKNPEGLALRFELPLVALKPSLLQPGRGGEALSTYLHELTHIFGGDRSAAFSTALTALLDRILRRHREIARFEQAWDRCFEERWAKPRCSDAG